MAVNKYPFLPQFDTRSKFAEQNYEHGSGISKPHTNWFQQLSVVVNKTPQIVAVPATLTSPGIAGNLSFDNAFIYFCIAPNVWKKAAWL